MTENASGLGLRSVAVGNSWTRSIATFSRPCRKYSHAASAITTRTPMTRSKRVRVMIGRLYRLLLADNPRQVLAVLALAERVGEPRESCRVNPALPEGDFLRTGDLQSLPALDRLDELTRFEQRRVRPGVEPG